MSTNTIDFSEFNKIQVQHTSRCRKFTKHKFAISLILIVILNITLTIILVYKNNKYDKKFSELSVKKGTLNEIESKILKIINQTSGAQTNLTTILNDISKDTDIDKIKSEYMKVDNEYDKILYTRNDLLAKKEYITNQINYKTQNLKENELISDIKQKNNLLEKIKNRLEDLSISNSNILIDSNSFESYTETEILNKCYDSVVYGFHVNKFHENCDGYPLLIMIKTKNGENIGAFTSKSNDGIRNIVDEDSILINFDKNKYFMNKLDENNECYVYCNIDEFPRFGNDLIIYRDGHGESKFPSCYNIIGQNKKSDFISQENFDIDIMEVYRIKLKYLTK